MFSRVLGIEFIAAISLLAFAYIPQLAFANGSQVYSTPGSYTFTVPSYGTLTVTVNGAGGGGGGGADTFANRNYDGSNGSSGGGSSFNGTVVGNGGGGGCGNAYNTACTGSAGSASGGDTNTTGGGGAGGAGGQQGYSYSGGWGGAGGKAVKTYTAGSLSLGANITIVVGSGGAGGLGGYPTAPYNGSAGSNGSVTVTWTAGPTCAVSLSPTTIPYSSSSQLAYSSSNATSFYIDNVGYVTANASSSFSVSPAQTTDYAGTTGNGVSTSTCPASLSVTPPSAPAATIAASSTSIYVGQSTNLFATFQAGSGDTLTADNIDEPVGSGQGATTNPGPQSITFTPTQLGTYTFYARATTQYYSSWTTYASITVTVLANPSCSISFAANPITQGATTTIYWISQNADSFSIDDIGAETPDTSGSTIVGPLAQATDYTGIASAGGVNAECTAAGSSPPGTLSLSCAPSYSCTGETIVRTNADCSTTNLTTCTAPQFCSPGVGACLYPSMSYQSFTDENGVQRSGDLQLYPSLVYPGDTTTVYWNVQNAQSCSVSGSNGDSWTGLFSGSSGKTSGPIDEQTIYALSCVGLDDLTTTEEQTANVVPIFREE